MYEYTNTYIHMYVYVFINIHMFVFKHISMHVGIDRDESYTHVRRLSRSLSLSPVNLLVRFTMSLSLPYVYIVCVAGCVAV